MSTAELLFVISYSAIAVFLMCYLWWNVDWPDARDEELIMAVVVGLIWPIGLFFYLASKLIEFKSNYRGRKVEAPSAPPRAGTLWEDK